LAVAYTIVKSRASSQRIGCEEREQAKRANCGTKTADVSWRANCGTKTADVSCVVKYLTGLTKR